MKKIAWETLVKEYEGSGMTMSGFARSRGVSASSFSVYLKRHKSEGSFVRVDSGEKIEFEVFGIKFNLDRTDLAVFLQAIRS
jgi:hypothetical protein